MAEETKQDNQKTIVAFVVGLLIGGLLVWAFSDGSADAPKKISDDEQSEVNDEASDDSDTESADENSATVVGAVPLPTLEVGEGDIRVNNQPAGVSVALDSAEYPVGEGWIGVREFNNDQLGYILGVVRFSESQGLVPDEIVLQRATIPGNRYAVVIFTEDGDFDFSLSGDVQIDTIYSTFTAQ
ncbi:MAG: hypothetical protein AAB388_01850 [Patescibacteria group bacterium]